MKKLLSFVLLVSSFLLADNIPTKDVHVVLKDDVPGVDEDTFRSESKNEKWVSILMFSLIKHLLDSEDEKDPEFKCNFSVGSSGMFMDLYCKIQREIEQEVIHVSGTTNCHVKERLTREAFDKLVNKTFEFNDCSSSCSVQTKPVIVSEEENRFAEDLKINGKTQMSWSDFKSLYQKYLTNLPQANR